MPFGDIGPALDAMLRVGLADLDRLLPDDDGGTTRAQTRLAALKAENDRVFFHALDHAPSSLRGKARMRWALDVLKMGDEYEEEKALRRRLLVERNLTDGG